MSQVPDVGDFLRQHSMQCPMALQRLVVVGLPATVEHGGGRSATSNSSAAVVAEITAAFITCLDSVRLNMLAVDQVLTRSPNVAGHGECAMPATLLGGDMRSYGSVQHGLIGHIAGT
jgi:VPS28 protein